MEPIDNRELNDPARDASRPYGQASADENALRALASLGERATLPTPDARDRNKREAPVALPPLVNPGTVVPLGSQRESTLDSSGTLMGGMGQTYPFLASNELLDRALPEFPPAVQAAFRNRKIERPTTVGDIYGTGVTTAGGFYQPPGDYDNGQIIDPTTGELGTTHYSQGRIVLGRGNAQAYGDPNVDVGGTMHEILHAISYEGQGFSQDRQAGYPQLRSLLNQYLPALVGNPQTSRAATEAETALAAGDGDHAFTAIGTAYVQGIPLPPELRAYFDQMKTYREALPGESFEAKPGLARGAFKSDADYQNYVRTGDWRTADPDIVAQVGGLGSGDLTGGGASMNISERVLGSNPFGKVLYDIPLRALGAGQSALDLITVHADKLIPGPGQSTIYDRYDLYRRAGNPPDKAANMAMADYGQALQEFAETPSAEGDFGNVASRAVAQGARAAGMAESILAPAPVPGGATLPLTLGALRSGAKVVSKAALPVIRDGASVIAERVVGGLSGRAMENAVALGTAAGPTALKREDVFREIGANLDKFGMDDSLKNMVLQNAADQYDSVLKMSFADQRRGTQTVKEIIQNAADKVPTLDINKLAATAPGTAMNGETLLAVGMALNKTAEDVRKLSQLVVTKGGSFEDKARLILQTTQMNALQRVFAGGRTEWGRAGVALQQIMTAAKTPKDMYDAAAKFIGGTDEAEQFMKSLDTLWNRVGIDPAQRDRDIFKFVLQLDKPGRFAWIPELWRNSILSNPITHEINTIGNAMLFATETVATRTAAATIEAARAGFGLRNVQREVYYSEVLPSVIAAFKAVPDGLAEGLHILAHGMDARDVNKFIESGGNKLRSEAIRGPVGAAINMPSRLLAGADMVFDQMTYKAELAAQAARGAAKEGLHGNAFKLRMADLMANPTDEILGAARTQADLVTLKSAPDKITSALLRLRRDVPGLQFVMPFITTPSNLLKLGVAYSPAGFLQAVPLKGSDRALMMGRAAVGTAIMGYFANQLLNGSVTAGVPQDPRERQLFYAEGKQPYSIKIGDNWIQFRRFEPLATPLNWTAAMFDAWQRGDGNFAKALPNMSLAVGRALLDTTYLSGMSQFIGALNDPNRNAEQFASSMAMGFIPFSGFLRGITQANDPYLRDPASGWDGFLETIEASLPGLSTRVRPQIDITGQPVRRPGSRQGIGAMLNPVVISPQVRNATLEELGKLHAPDTLDRDGKVIPGAQLMLDFPSDSIRSLGLTADESYGLNQEAQQRSMRNLSAAFASDEYMNATDAGKRIIAQKAITDARSEARGVIAEQAVQTARTPDQFARAVVMRLGALGDLEGPTTKGQRALYLGSLVEQGKMTPQIERAVNAAKSADEPTVAEYLRAAPKVKDYAALPPFRTGDTPEWAALEQARALRAKIAREAQTPAQKDPKAVDAVFRATDPKAAALYAKYDDSRIRDPRRAAMLKENPWLETYVGGLDYEQVK